MTRSSTTDFLIVGAGSAGCTLANRLSEDPNNRVRVLEAGGWDRDPLIHIPLGWGKILQKRLHDWKYFCEPEPNVDNRRVECARGKVVGGSSSINAMAWVRGNHGDFDRWANDYGLSGWSWENAFPYFRKQESWQGEPSAYRGIDGPINTQFCKYEDPLIDAYMAAATAAGHGQTDDYNGEVQEGFGRLQMSIREGRRCSGATAYLKPALKRSNLDIDVNALVTRVLFDGTRAVGVEYRTGGVTKTIYAEREVILSGGVINSPQLLMLSGIGDPAALSKHGIDVRQPLPGVGLNLQDHVSVILMYTRKMPGPFLPMLRADRIVREMAKAYLYGSGFAADVPGGVTSFLKSEPGLLVPDIQFLLTAAPLAAHPYLKPFKQPFKDGFATRVVLLHPESRGQVELAGPEPDRLAVIRQNFLAKDADWVALRKGVRMAHELSLQTPMAPFMGAQISPGQTEMTDEQIDAHIRATSITVHHPLGTCRMGTDATSNAVVDPSLRVRGCEGLRVVDASVMPDMITGNINAAVVMIAERAADLILNKTGQPGNPARMVSDSFNSTTEV